MRMDVVRMIQHKIYKEKKALRFKEHMFVPYSTPYVGVRCENSSILPLGTCTEYIISRRIFLYKRHGLKTTLLNTNDYSYMLAIAALSIDYFCSLGILIPT